MLLDDEMNRFKADCYAVCLFLHFAKVQEKFVKNLGISPEMRCLVR